MARPDQIMLDIARYPAHFEITTRFQDLDSNNHINNVVLAAIFEDIRVRFDKLVGLHDIVRPIGMRTVIASLQIDYLGESYYPAPIDAYIGTLEIGRSSWTVAAVAKQGTTLVSFMRATIVNTQDSRAVALPDEFRPALAAYALGPSQVSTPDCDRHI